MIPLEEDLHALHAEFDEDILADMGAVPGRDEEDFRTVRCLFAHHRPEWRGDLYGRFFCILRTHSNPLTSSSATAIVEIGRMIFSPWAIEIAS